MQETNIIDAFIEATKPVFEMSIVFASMYANACGRNTVTSTDMHYGLCYSIRNITGEHNGSLFPEAYDSQEDDEEEEEEEEVDDESCDDFTIYNGTNETILAMNNAVDSWDEWEPTSPLEIHLYNAVSQVR